MKTVSVEQLCVICFVRSGMHTLPLVRVWEYGAMLEKELGDGWLVRRGVGCLSEPMASVAVEGDSVRLLTDVSGLLGVLDSIGREAVDAAGRVAWRS